MKSRTLKSAILSAALVAATAVPHAALAQSVAREAARQEQSTGGGSVSINNQAGRVSIRLERGSKVSVSNRYGRITVTGWDRDTVEAVATSAKGPEAVQVDMTADPQANTTLSLAVASRGRSAAGLLSGAVAIAPGAVWTEALSATAAAAVLADKAKAKEQADKDKDKDKAKGAGQGTGQGAGQGSNTVVLPPGSTSPPQPPARVSPPAQAAQPSQPTPRPAPRPGMVYAPGTAAARAEEVHLDVKVPRYATLETIEVRAGDLSVSGIDGPVTIAGGSSKINVSRVGALTVRARSGDVTVDGVDGLVYVVTNSGDISVRNVNSEVRATAINGDINVACVKGRVDVSTTVGKITLANVGDLVDAVTTNSEIVFTGPITDGGRYRLKSMEGRVLMAIPEGSPGFTANLMSYNRQVMSEFPLKNSTPNPMSPQVIRRGEAHHGNGRAVILLDSFGQNVQLTKLAPGAAASCTR